MHSGTTITSVANALNAACLRDLPDITYVDRDWKAHCEQRQQLTRDERAEQLARERASNVSQAPTVNRQRRPRQEECDVISFPQTWPNTQHGYEGVAGHAMTTAQTVVVRCVAAGATAVYFGDSGRLAYLIPTEREADDWLTDMIKDFDLASVAEARRIGLATFPDHGD